MLVHFTHSGSDLPFLIHQHHIYILYSTKYMMQQLSHKTLALLTIRQLLSQQSRLIVVSVDIACYPFFPSSALLYHVIGDNLTLLLHSRDGDIGIFQGWLVVTKYICWSLHWDNHHPEFVPESLEVFPTFLRCNEFTSEKRALHTCLLLWNPVHRCTI